MSVLLPAVRRSLVVALVAALALASLVALGPSRGGSAAGAPATMQGDAQPVAQAVSRYTPVTGAIFNRPVGSPAEKRAIFTHVNRTIDAVPSGGTIRIAVFSFSEKATADALLRAKARGVAVQLVFDNHHVFPQQARLRRALGKNRRAASFVVFCKHACRGTRGDMHDKFFLFSRAGRADFVTMVGSNNMTSFNAERQWSDVYTVANDPGMYWSYAGIFDQLKRARPMARSFYQLDINGYRSQFFPLARTTPYTDPVAVSLAKVRCTDTEDDTGVDGRTLVRIAQHAWFGPRGTYLASQVANLARQGCVVQVVPGVTMGRNIRKILTAAGVRLARVRHPRMRTHQKTLLISGNFEGDPAARVVFTGSHNWSGRGLTNDDVILRISDPAAHAQYTANFADQWWHG